MPFRLVFEKHTQFNLFAVGLFFGNRKEIKEEKKINSKNVKFGNADDFLMLAKPKNSGVFALVL